MKFSQDINIRLASGQIWLTVLWLTMVFVVLIIFELGQARLSPEGLKIFDHVIGWLKDATLIILYFWFQRIRTGGIPDAPIVTHTAPDGSTTTISAKPLPSTGNGNGAHKPDPTVVIQENAK